MNILYQTIETHHSLSKVNPDESIAHPSVLFPFQTNMSHHNNSHRQVALK